MSGFNVRTASKEVLRKINSMTKYPSIPTYHTMDTKKGGLLEEPTPHTFTGRVLATEKIDGVNARIILLPDGTYLLGSREELFYAQGDLIGNNALGIVDQLVAVAERCPNTDKDRIVCLYVELYGGDTNAGRQYSDSKTAYGWRLFDCMVQTYPDAMLCWEIQTIALWRQRGEQYFMPEDDLAIAGQVCNLQLTPRLFFRHANEMPTHVDAMHELLKEQLPCTEVGLAGKAGKSEGIVFRTRDRSVIAKARFQDYERTVRRREQEAMQP